MAETKVAAGGGFSVAKYPDILLAIGVIGIIGVMIVPLPTFVMDILLTFNITFSLVVLVNALYVSAPLQLSVFPSLLLVVTLFRLSLNVASTRLILSRGYAGQVIQSFGDFVVGGNYVIGVIVFIILVVINFMVITKGSGAHRRGGAPASPWTPCPASRWPSTPT